MVAVQSVDVSVVKFDEACVRTRLIDKETITSLIQLEYSGFAGATVPICTFTLQTAAM